MAEILKELKKAKLDPEDKVEEVESRPTAELASEIREAQVEVVRIAKVCSNMKGPLQRPLKVAASTTMAGIEVLRTRADETGEKTGNEELRILRQKVEKLNNAQEKTEATMNEMKAQMDKLKKKADEEKEKRDKAMKQLRAVITENGLLKGKMEELRKKHAQEMERAKAIALNPPELMEVEIMPVSPTAETTRTTSTPTSPVRTLPTTRELKEWPAFRPPIRGKTMRIPETQCFTSRDLPPPPEVEEIRKSSKVSKKRRKGEGGVAWNEMELCSTTTIEKERREVQEAHEGSSTREGGRAGRLEPSRTPPPSPLERNPRKAGPVR